MARMPSGQSPRKKTSGDSSRVGRADEAEVKSCMTSHALTLHAVALGLIDFDQGRELRLEGALCGVHLSERTDDLLLLQLVLDRQRKLREPLEIRARMELQLFELREDDERSF